MFFRKLLSILSLGLVLQACANNATDDRVSQNSALINSGIRDKLIMMGTGSKGGSFMGVGDTLCDAINSHRSESLIRCVNVPSAGSTFNMFSVANGSLQMGLSHEAVSAEIFADPNIRMGRELRTVAVLYSTPMAIMVRKASGLKSLNDLSRGVVNLGPKGSGSNTMAIAMFAGLGLSETDLPRRQYLSPSETIKAFCQGKVDVVFNIQVHPSPFYRDLRKCGGEFISMSPELIQKMRTAHPSLRPAQLPAGIYDPQQKLVETLEIRTVLFTNASVDDATVYRFVKILLAEQAQMAVSQPQLKISQSTSPEEALVLPVPIHPGALRALKEFQK